MRTLIISSNNKNNEKPMGTKKTTHNIQPIWIRQCKHYVVRVYVCARARLIVRLEGMWSISRTRVYDFHFPIPHIARNNNNNENMPKMLTIYFSLFIFASRKRKEQQCFGPFQLRFSITHCSNFPSLVARRALTQSVALSPLSIIFYLRINSPKKNCTHMRTVSLFLNNQWMVRIFLRIALCLFFVSFFFFFFVFLLSFDCFTHSHDLVRGKERKSPINFHKWWTVVNCSLFMCLSTPICLLTCMHVSMHV